MFEPPSSHRYLLEICCLLQIDFESFQIQSAIDLPNSTIIPPGKSAFVEMGSTVITCTIIAGIFFIDLLLFLSRFHDREIVAVVIFK